VTDDESTYGVPSTSEPAGAQPPSQQPASVTGSPGETILPGRTDNTPPAIPAQPAGEYPAPQPPHVPPQPPQVPSQPGYPGQPAAPVQPATYPGQAAWPSQPAYPGQPGYGPAAQPTFTMGTMGAAAGGADVLVSGPQRRRRKAMPIVVSAIAVVAVVAAGGAFAAHRLLASSGGQPDAFAPASSVAYGKVDLDPSASTKVAAWEFEQHFPSAPKVASADDLKDALLASAFKSDPTIDYNADIKPWLGDRVGAAAFVGSDGQLAAVAILQVTDDAKAKAALQKLTAPTSGTDDSVVAQPIGFTISNGYAILGQSQAVVDDALAQAKQHDITSTGTYSKDVGSLGSNQVATAWADYGALVKAELANTSGAAASLSVLGISPEDYKGRFAMALTVQPSYLQVTGREFGFSSTFQVTPGTAGQALGDLRSGTVAGIAVSNPEAYLKNLLTQLESSPLLAQGIQQEFDQAGLQVGMKLPDDALNLLGSEFVLGLDAMPDPQNPDSTPVTIVTKPDDAAKALTTAQKLAQLATQGGVPLHVSGDTHITITNDPTPGAGRLGDDPTYQAAMAGMPSQVSMAGYVDLGAIAKSDPAATADAAHLGGLGFYASVDSGSPMFELRLTVK
jgi:Protein of unknown function (DUF3352)